MNRSLIINNKKPIFKEKGNILYLMIRDCRIEDNWALLFAQEQALKNKQGLIIGFTIIIDISNRQYKFLIEGLKEVNKKAKKLNIDFTIIKKSNIDFFIKKNNITQIISDFSPLKSILNYKKKVNISFIDIDTHNVVPVWITSNKQEYAARTIRKKIYSQLKKFITEPPNVIKHPFYSNLIQKKINWNWYKPKINNKEINWCKGGYSNGMKQLTFFINNIKGYSVERNNPLKNKISNLSPWLHFGNIYSLRCYLEVKKSKYKSDVDSFIEEIIIRKELSDNYCYYNNNYDSLKGLPNWSFESLKKHEIDKRSYNYNLKNLLNGETHDKVWNFAQKQLIDYGKIHGYMRMYWCKKIIEWSEKLEIAYNNSLYLNDVYSIDGNDPNGYVGVLWCFGLHDRAWNERFIYGKVRYMNKIGLELRNKI